jgi:NAD(P)H-dependent FMN reductase
MKIAIVSGSHRADSQSDRVARYIAQEVERAQGKGDVISLSKNPLPLWDEGVWSNDPRWAETWGPISKRLKACDALVLVAPEWAGMVPPGLKNFLLLCSAAEVGHKPALIVSVSSGIGGSYPVAELRVSSYKNNRIVYIPEHVIVRNVEDVLQGDAPSSERDEATRARLRYGVAILKEYAQALRSVRESGTVDHKSFPFGM